MLATSPTPGAQLDEWMAYDRIEPFGDERGDMQAGIAANMLRAMHGLEPLPPRAYVLQFDEPDDDDEEMSEEKFTAMEAGMKAWAARSNAFYEQQA